MGFGWYDPGKIKIDIWSQSQSQLSDQVHGSYTAEQWSYHCEDMAVGVIPSKCRLDLSAFQCPISSHTTHPVTNFTSAGKKAKQVYDG